MALIDDVSPELLARIAAGDCAAFRVIVEKYQNLLFDLALRLIGNRQDAEDLVQESFVRIYRSLPRFDPDRKFLNWAYSITLNLARNQLRRRSLLKFLSLDFGPNDLAEQTSVPAAPDPEGGPVQLLEKAAFARDFERAVAGLPLPLKEVFVLFYFHENDVRSIAEALGVTENAVKLKLMRARKFVQSEISATCPEMFAGA
ncbi:MAG: RNA polymerase sigma factor [Elusimicrobiota bacterium]